MEAAPLNTLYFNINFSCATNLLRSRHDVRGITKHSLTEGMAPCSEEPHYNKAPGKASSSEIMQ